MQIQIHTQNKIRKVRPDVFFSIFLSALLAWSVPLSAFAVIYEPGETLNPTCLPTDIDCGVSSASFSSGLTVGTGAPTSTVNTLYNDAGVLFWNGSAVLSGLSLNGLASSTQLFAVGSTGADFGISSSGNVHTFNIPDSSAAARGLLTAADWTTFNGKQNALGFTPVSNTTTINGQALAANLLFSTADISDSLNRRYVTDAGLTVLGNTSGVNTGDQTTISGNAGTATALQTARTINGVAFDGTANITITAAADAGTLTGATLALNVLNSSLTSVGTLTNLTVATSITNPLVIGGTDPASPLTLRSTSGVGATGADIIFQTGNNGSREVMRVFNDGRVAIGTSTPDSQLTVEGDSASGYGSIMISRTGNQPNIVLKYNGANSGQLRGYTNRMSFTNWNGVTELFTTDTVTGNVGIGTTAPGEKLEVVGNIISKGTSWTDRTPAETNNWSSVAYGNGLFVAVSTSGSNRVMTSPDGVTWTPRTAAASNLWNSVTYGNGLFVAVAQTGVNNRVMTSPDGVTWTSRSTAGLANAWSAVTYGNGVFVAVAFGGQVMTSPDGVTWTSRTASITKNWGGITYGNGVFVAVAGDGDDTNAVMTSPNGITWTTRTAANTDNWTSVTYGNGLFVALSANGNDITNAVMTSPDGITWTLRTTPSGSGWIAVNYGNGLFVALSFDSPIITSPDGITWTNRTPPSASPWSSVAYGNGVFAAVSSGGSAMTSGKAEINVTSANNIFQGGMSILGNIGIGTTSASTLLEIASSDLGNGAAGPVITLGRNTNATANGAGSINFLSRSGTAGYVWQDAAGNMRVNTAAPTNANDNNGNVIGSQSSTRETKQDIKDYTDYDQALSMVLGAPLHTFRYIKEVNGYGSDSPLAKARIGYIADEVDPAFMVGNSIDQVSVNGILMASIKALDLKMQDFHVESVPVADITPEINDDGADNGLSTLVASIQSEVARNPVAVIAHKIANGKKFVTDFVAARVTAIRGYFDEVFAKKIHTNEVCVKKSGGQETCLNGDQLEVLLKNASASTPPPVPEEPTVAPSPAPAPAAVDESSVAAEPDVSAPVLEPIITPEPTAEPETESQGSDSPTDQEPAAPAETP